MILFVQLKLLIKRILCKPAFIPVLCLVPALMLAVSLLPEKSRSTEIVSGVYIEQSDKYTDDFEAYLLSASTGFTFRIYASPDMMKDDVASNVIDAGYVLPSGISSSMISLDSEGLISVYTTANTAFYEVSSESIYAALLHTYAADMSIGLAHASDSYISDYIRSRFKGYISDGEVFAISGGLSGHYEAENIVLPDTFPVRILVYITIFTAALIGLQLFYNDKENGVYLSLSSGRLFSFRIKNTATGIIPAAVINLISLICYNGASSMPQTIISVCLCSVISLIAAMLLGMIFKTCRSYTVALPFMIICTILLAVISQI